jgi:hypothetical protein
MLVLLETVPGPLEGAPSLNVSRSCITAAGHHFNGVSENYVDFYFRTLTNTGSTVFPSACVFSLIECSVN